MMAALPDIFCVLFSCDRVCNEFMNLLKCEV